MHELPLVTAWISRMSAMCGPSPFQELYIAIEDPSWSNFRNVRMILQSLRVGHLERQALEILCLRKRAPTARLWRFLNIPQEHRKRLYSILNEALDVGEEARNESWDSERMEREFQKWLRVIKKRPYVKQQLARYRR